jgi:hypothetical protein
MKIYYSKVLGAFFFGSLILISCKSAQNSNGISPTETIPSIPSPTTIPYWDLLPLDRDPDGGWTTLVLEETDISFQIPSVYQTGDCGKLVTFDKDVANYKAQVIGFQDSQIQLHIYSEWEEDLDKLVKEGAAPRYSPLISPVEQVTLGGIPAVRYIATNPDQEMVLYSKGVWASYHDKLYSFSFISAPYLPSCDAIPLSEEQVFEYLISTVEFLE